MAISLWSHTNPKMTAAQFKICMFTYFIQYLLHFTILRSYRNLQNKISKVGLNGCAYWSITRPNTVLYITAPDAKSLGLEVHRFSDKPAYEFKCRLLTFTTWSFEILHLDPIGLHFYFRETLWLYTDLSFTSQCPFPTTESQGQLCWSTVEWLGRMSAII